MTIHNYDFAGDDELVMTYLEGDKEITINVTEGLHATLTTSIRRYITKSKKLAKEHPNEVTIIENQDGSVFITFPIEWIKFPSPKKKISDENKAKAAERMRKAREAKK